MVQKNKHSSLRSFLSVFLLSGLLPLLLVACSGKPITAVQNTPTPIPTVAVTEKQTFQVQRGEMIHELHISGRIAPAVRQELSFTAAGRVAKVHVGLGDTVTEGQLLAELESSRDEYAYRRAEANLKIAQLRLDLAKLQAGPSPEIQKINVAIQEQEVALAQVDVDEMNASYAGTVINSPVGGIVYSVSISDGSTVDANEPVIVIASMENLVVTADVKPDDLPLLTVGLPATVSAVGRAIPDSKATIQSLPYPYGGGDKASTSTLLALAKSPTELGYRSGDMVNINFVLEMKSDALWLPVQAVREFEGRYFVTVKDANGQRRVDVKVGIIEPEKIEITEGLSEGQVVVAP
jgi:RND family efflux transporter MFP subunit